MRTGKLDSAVVILMRMRQKEETPEVDEYLACCMMIGGHQDKALSYTKKNLLLNPTSQTARYQLNLLTFQRCQQDAELSTKVPGQLKRLHKNAVEVKECHRYFESFIST